MAKLTTLPFSSSLLASAETPPKFAALSVPALPLRNGLPRGGITEISGLRSSGRTAAVLHILAQATARGEICAVVDACDAFHPASAAAAGVKLSRIVWVRCRGNAEHALRAADLLLHAWGFGVIALDLCEVTPRALNQIPFSYWYRFRQTIEHIPTALLICASTPQAKASVRQMELELQAPRWDGAAPFCFLQGMDIAVKLRKPMEGRPQQLSLERTG
jgi:recombination protein RecA